MPSSAPKWCQGGKSDRVTVNIIAQDGSEWIKVLASATEKKLMYKFARAGYEEFSDDEDDEDADFENDFLDSFPLIQQTKALIIAFHAASATEYRRPRIRMLFQQLRRGGPKLIGKFFHIAHSWTLEASTQGLSDSIQF
jgi:hypothetical protein